MEPNDETDYLLASQTNADRLKESLAQARKGNFVSGQFTTDEELEKRFGYHKATPETIDLHQDVRGNFLELAKFLNVLLPEGREKSLAFTALQEAAMWSNASVACNLAPLDLNG